MSKTLADLRDAVIAQLQPKYDLCYVDQGDKLTDEQIAAMFRGEDCWEDANPYYATWYADNQHHGATYHAKDEGQSMLQQWLREEVIDDDTYAELESAWEGSKEYDEVIDEIKDRDESDPLKQLAHASGRVLMRVTFSDEDHAWSFKKIRAKKALGRARLPRTEENIKKMDYLLANASPEFSVLLGYYIFAMDVGDFFDMPYDTEWIEVVNPHVWYGSPFTGSGWCEGPFEGTVRFRRDELRTDKDAFGYGWDDVAGVHVPYYDCEVRAVPTSRTAKRNAEENAHG